MRSRGKENHRHRHLTKKPVLSVRFLVQTTVKRFFIFFFFLEGEYPWYEVWIYHSIRNNTFFEHYFLQTTQLQLSQCLVLCSFIELEREYLIHDNRISNWNKLDVKLINKVVESISWSHVVYCFRCIDDTRPLHNCIFPEQCSENSLCLFGN